MSSLAKNFEAKVKEQLNLLDNVYPIRLYDFIGAYLDYHDYIVLRQWRSFGSRDDFEIVKVLF